ncbi:Cyst germination specific acidic repeat protein [Phytophthora nicotianae]|uniref:2-oxoisovalerate dehydrogenase subunit alpha n=1 Tax=Phytophthora nicotianae TaxID=4792 RepID=A0A0W8CTY6_PHYNI|nr:Cyst germination specific acidic repeat protein [Phytophthora nicotianae]
MPFVPEVVFRDPKENDPIPCFRILNENGDVVEGATDPQLSQDLCTQIYSQMIRLNTMDNIFYDAQRQGRISFYMTSYGEEAISFGSSSALRLGDMVFAQYREPGVLMWRGFTLQEFADQCFSNKDGHGKGRQMPVHYGSKNLNHQTISSPLATQLPQAAGAAYAFKLAKEDRISVCYFGEGAASEGDFHAALNFASTKDCPILFFVRNNGFAISTPTKEQFRGDGIASRGSGYGIPIMRYRAVAEIKHWKETCDPIERTKRYLLKRSWITEEQDRLMQDNERTNVLAALQQAETKGRPVLETMFEDVYDVKLPHLLEQEREMLEHVSKYPDYYTEEH